MNDDSHTGDDDLIHSFPFMLIGPGAMLRGIRTLLPVVPVFFTWLAVLVFLPICLPHVAIADALDQSKIVNVAVAEAAAVPLVPTGLPPGLKLALALVIAALMSLGVGFVGEYLDPSFRTPTEVKEYLEIPLLATLPRNGR